MARSLRIRAKLKQREVADAIGVRASTYGNIESSSFKIIRRDRVDDMSRLYKLDAAQHAQLVAAWERAPISEYSAKQREGWAKRNEMRNRSKQRDAFKLVLCDLLDSIATNGSVGAPIPYVCTCIVADPFLDQEASTCDLCRAFHVLGFPDGYVSPEVAMARIEQVSPEAPNQRPHVANVPHIPDSSSASPETR